VVCRRNDTHSVTDNQVVSMQIGTLPGPWYPDEGFNDLWARMNTSGTAGNDGVRLRIGWGVLKLSAFVGGTETVLRQRPLLIPPLPGEWWSLTCGDDSNNRHYSITRNGITIMDVVFGTSGDPSNIDSSHRGWGFGMHAGAGVFAQVEPATILAWGADDNASQAQSGFLSRVNASDQNMWDRFTVYGPGTFYLGQANTTEQVVFGPLLANQVVQIRTDPRRRGVVDLSTAPAPPQQLTLWQQAIKDVVSFATAGNVPPLLQALENRFGIIAPQGNLYSLMNGRFSNPIPAKPPGTAPQVYQIPVSIVGGSAASRIVVAGTPQRRFPY
jgi:hypothetical protein